MLSLQEVLAINVLLALMGGDKGRVRYEIRWWERETGSQILVMWIPYCLCDEITSGRGRGHKVIHTFLCRGCVTLLLSLSSPSVWSLRRMRVLLVQAMFLVFLGWIDIDLCAQWHSLCFCYQYDVVLLCCTTSNESSVWWCFWLKRHHSRALWKFCFLRKALLAIKRSFSSYVDVEEEYIFCASFCGYINVCKYSFICASARVHTFIASSPPIFMCPFSQGQ